jgi:resuscitation-promoting factor RpfA
MARYHGRHRAPSTTGRAIARTAIAGAMAGAPLLVTMPAANAATDSTWDRVAQCESGGNWQISTGNGFQGGLQFTPTTWSGFGGVAFAPTANQATREQQIVVAERVLAGQGWNAWPVCSKKAGATGEAPAQRAAPAVAPAQAASIVTSAPTTDGGYVVKSGDTLSGIAAAHGVAGGWEALVQKNSALATNPDTIFPGQRLTV